MSFRYLRLAMGLLVVAVVLLTPVSSWAVFYPLGPSKDEWGLKYDVQVSAAEGDKLNVQFTLADQGRLKPIYSATVIVFSNPRPDGGRTYLVKEAIELTVTEGGTLTGQAQCRKDLASRAVIRILTVTFDGRHQSAGARYYDIPLQKYLNKAAVAASPQTPRAIASPPPSKVIK